MTGVSSMLGLSKKLEIPAAEDMLPGRAAAVPVAEQHFVLDAPLGPPFPAQTRLAMVRPGLFLGPGKTVLEPRRRLFHRGGLRRWFDAQPDL